ncbi:Serine protease [Posidoniimonas polymericola]|uniref:Serine protease n=1 Tax=Posidoniimonas polymericola TaxID=2528002 RepID=A0A5C5YRT2_9BACT|nr:serine protease [Posidoniimonas polymericola]TWT77417.1 Serine protease [Posidoniimonas polymericola]
MSKSAVHPKQVTGRLTRVAIAAAVVVCCAPLAAAAPHPSVARIIVQEQGATAFGSGSLIDRREQYGMVITNWHVVRDAVGKIEVVFPDGFRSEARALKLDEDWDLAALVIWRPTAEPIPLAAAPPRPGDALTICGYGQGDYRAATGRCTEFYAPEVGMPRELVELSVEARQGDSGGPILNARGELAGVLFGASNGTTLGSFAPRVETFLASVAPDIGRRGIERLSPGALSPGTLPTSIPSTPALIAHGPPPGGAGSESLAGSLPGSASGWQSLAGPQELSGSQELASADVRCCPSPDGTCPDGTCANSGLAEEGRLGEPWPERPVAKDLFTNGEEPQGADSYAQWTSAESKQAGPAVAAIPAVAAADINLPQPPWFDGIRNVLAVIGVTFLFLQLVRIVS